MAKTSASFTLMDYTDGISLITGIDSNLPLTQLYDTDIPAFSPDWSAVGGALQLTPTVLKAGGNGSNLVDVMVSNTVKWYRRMAGESSWTQVVSGSNNEVIDTAANHYKLLVSANKLVSSYSQMDYKFAGTYHDNTLNLDFPVEIKITLSKVNNGTSFVVGRAYAPAGSQFKNNQPASLTCIAELIRGTTIDPSLVSYEWYKSTNGTSWTKLDAEHPQGTSGYATDTLTITPVSVDSFAMFRCEITDNDPETRPDPNVPYITEGVAFYDVTDPYQAVIESTTGSYFKGDVQTTKLICRVFQNGVEIDAAGGGQTYTWTATDADGDKLIIPGSSPATYWEDNPTYTDVTWRGQTIQASSHKAVLIANNLVDVKSTFYCEVQ